MSVIEQRQQALLDDFSLLEDWQDKYVYLMDLGEQLTSFPEEQRIEANLVEGCQSQVWMTIDAVDSQLHMQATSDAAIVRGLIAMIIKVYDGQAPQDILNHPPQFISEIGLDRFISPTRSNGLNAFLTNLFTQARAHLND